MSKTKEDYAALARKITVDAEKLAATLKMDIDSKKLTATQIRRFYNHLKQIHQVVEHDDDNFMKKLPIIKLTLAQVNYAGSRKEVKISPAYTNFITSELKSIQTRQQFNDFMLYFEAVLGYCGHVK